MNQPPLNPDALEEACAGFYNDHMGLTNWQRLCSADPALADKYRAGMKAAVSAYLAAALPEVTEREQLTALPDKIVLEDRRGTIWQKINGTWYTPGSKHDYSDQSVMLPARVLYRQEVKP